MLEDSQKLALITGGATRVGKYIAQKLASHGWKIALHYHASEVEAYELAKELLPLVDIMLFKADLTKPDQAISMASEVKRQMGEITLLINNASIHKNDNIENLNPIDFERNLNIHLSSPVYLAKAMNGSRGNIINILDTTITKNRHKFFSYSLSKNQC